MFNESQMSCGGSYMKRSSTGKSFSEAFDELTTSGMYWKNLPRKEAETILKSSNHGDFLIRDSSSSNCIFTLSLKSSRKVLHVRILYQRGKFSLESEYVGKQPYFDSIVNMIEHYIEKSKAGLSVKLVSRTLQESRDLLLRPLKRTCPTLKHLCRVHINKVKEGVSLEDWKSDLPIKLKEFVEEYPYKV